MNFDRYPWLQDLDSVPAHEAIEVARQAYQSTGAAIFPGFITKEALTKSRNEALAKADTAFVTDDVHTAHQLAVDPLYPKNSVRNHFMRTQVASIAYDELEAVVPVSVAEDSRKHMECPSSNNGSCSLSSESALRQLYQHETLRRLVARIVFSSGESNGDDEEGPEEPVVQQPELFLSDDPLGACSINVFWPTQHHSFHFDESEFSTTLMLQEDSGGGGLFQHTYPLRQSDITVSKQESKHDDDNLALADVAAALKAYDKENGAPAPFVEDDGREPPPLHTLDFKPGALSIFSGSKSLHRVTRVTGEHPRMVAVLTFSATPGFRNSPEVQKMFWGRSSAR